MVDGSVISGNKITAISSKRRNSILADVFSRLKLMERRGSRFKIILRITYYVATLTHLKIKMRI